MAKRFSDFQELVTPTGVEEALLAFDGNNYRFKLRNIVGLIPIPTKAQIGLGNVDNTSDASKPISTATQAALNTKADQVHQHPQSQVIGLVNDIVVINQRIQGVTDSISSLLNTVGGHTTQLGQHSTLITDLTNDLATLLSNFNSLVVSVTALTSNLAAVSSTVNNHTVQINGILAQLPDTDSVEFEQTPQW